MQRMTIKLLKTKYVEIFTKWADNLLKEDIDFPELDTELPAFNDRLEELLNQNEWSQEDRIELSVIFFLASIIPDMEEDDSDDLEDDDDTIS